MAAHLLKIESRCIYRFPPGPRLKRTARRAFVSTAKPKKASVRRRVLQARLYDDRASDLPPLLFASQDDVGGCVDRRLSSASQCVERLDGSSWTTRQQTVLAATLDVSVGEEGGQRPSSALLAHDVRACFASLDRKAGLTVCL
jgi:hypothetical protein